MRVGRHVQRLNGKTVGIAIGVVFTLALAVIVGRSTAGEGGEKASQVVVPRAVERRTHADTLSVSGELRRDELQTINSDVDGKVSWRQVSDGDTLDVGDTLFDLEGRSSVAVDGEFAFFRQLDGGSDGPDVEQLERILSEQG